MCILSNFGENLKELISERDLDAAQLAEIVDIDVSVIYRYLRKECLPSLKNFIILADYFECSGDYLLGLYYENKSTCFKQAPPFSERFKKILNDNKTTRYKVRKSCNFARQSVDDWYFGKYMPTIENVMRLKKFFDCSIDELLGRE